MTPKLPLERTRGVSCQGNGMWSEACKKARRNQKGVARVEHSRRRNKVSKWGQVGKATIVRKCKVELVGNRVQQ